MVVSGPITAMTLRSRAITRDDSDFIVMDGGEWLKGAAEFSHLGDLLTDAQWEAMKPKKKAAE